MWFEIMYIDTLTLFTWLSTERSGSLIRPWHDEITTKFVMKIGSLSGFKIKCVYLLPILLCSLIWFYNGSFQDVQGDQLDCKLST